MMVIMVSIEIIVWRYIWGAHFARWWCDHGQGTLEREHPALLICNDFLSWVGMILLLECLADELILMALIAVYSIAIAIIIWILLLLMVMTRAAVILISVISVTTVLLKTSCRACHSAHIVLVVVIKASVFQAGLRMRLSISHLVAVACLLLWLTLFVARGCGHCRWRERLWNWSISLGLLNDTKDALEGLAEEPGVWSLS